MFYCLLLVLYMKMFYSYETTQLNVIWKNDKFSSSSLDCVSSALKNLLLFLLPLPYLGVVSFIEKKVLNNELLTNYLGHFFIVGNYPPASKASTEVAN